MKPNTKRGFTLLELIGAIVVIMILVSVVLVVNGTARQRTLETRFSADMEAINTAKHMWVLDHPNEAAAFNNADESSRFSMIKGYLDPMQSSAGTLDGYAPSGVVYHINPLGTPASH